MSAAKPTAKPDRPDLPTSIRLSPEDVDRAEALRAIMARAAGLDSASALPRHVVLIAAVRAGLAVLEKKHAASKARGR